MEHLGAVPCPEQTAAGHGLDLQEEVIFKLGLKETEGMLGA